MEFYGVDLLDFWRGRLTLRKLVTYLVGLMQKETSCLRMHLAGEEGRWNQQTHLLADIVDLSNRTVWLTAMLAYAQGYKKKDFRDPPALLERPGVVKPQKKVRFASGPDAMAFAFKKAIAEGD